MLYITGAGSRIAQELKMLLPVDEWVSERWDFTEKPPLEFDRYLMCDGYIQPLRRWEQHADAKRDSYLINFGKIVDNCDYILENNPSARICIIGSESGFSGSYDGSYSAAKAALHHYIYTRPLQPEQQLVGIAPTIIIDTNMTASRTDQDRVRERAEKHPKKRWLFAHEVARLVHFCLYVDNGYLTGTVIRMHGGSGSREGP